MRYQTKRKRMRGGIKPVVVLLNGQTRPNCFKEAFVPFVPDRGIGIRCHNCIHVVECSGRPKIKIKAVY